MKLTVPMPNFILIFGAVITLMDHLELKGVKTHASLQVSGYKEKMKNALCWMSSFILVSLGFVQS